MVAVCTVAGAVLVVEGDDFGRFTSDRLPSVPGRGGGRAGKCTPVWCGGAWMQVWSEALKHFLWKYLLH